MQTSRDPVSKYDVISSSSTDVHAKIGVASLDLWPDLVQKVVGQYLPHSGVVTESDPTLSLCSYRTRLRYAPCRP